ncbi:hypothetical protein [Amycolatopsis sp. A133]|uniref:hypothetical protein n=1 Tax=Amycolatopsis sp. A133 TaxID=3064472 RepID=UPI0037BE2531
MVNPPPTPTGVPALAARSLPAAVWRVVRSGWWTSVCAFLIVVIVLLAAGADLFVLLEGQSLTPDNATPTPSAVPSTVAPSPTSSDPRAVGDEREEVDTGQRLDAEPVRPAHPAQRPGGQPGRADTKELPPNLWAPIIVVASLAIPSMIGSEAAGKGLACPRSCPVADHPACSPWRLWSR